MKRALVTREQAEAMNKPTAAAVGQQLRYDLGTGQFTWVVRRNGLVGPGVRAGYMDKDGYVVVKLNRKVLRAHRIAWLLMTGAWPSHEIDHINGDRSDNRWANLRHVDRLTNVQNMRKPRRDNRTGLLGVSIRPNGTFQAGIGIDGRIKHLGTFKAAHEAHAAYLDAKRRLHKGNTL